MFLLAREWRNSLEFLKKSPIFIELENVLFDLHIDDIFCISKIFF